MEDSSSLEHFGQTFDAVVREVGRVVLGQEATTRAVLVALIAGGHVLLEGPPGIGKTLLARSLSHVLGLDFRRIQFTPDLMPSDVTGGNVFDPRSRDFDFRAGPVFAQLLLADEVNRAPAKTQAALLEAMGDRQVSVDGVTRPLPRPFFVLATQNPVENEGTYPLPEAQLDRFVMKLALGHPDEAVEVALLRNVVAGFDATELEFAQLKTCLDAETLLRMREIARQVHVDDSLLHYIVQVVGRTRRHPEVALGASPRAAVSLVVCAQALAASERRAYVLPDDVKWLAPAVLRHRFLLEPDAELEGVTSDEVIDGILREIPVPERRG